MGCFYTFNVEFRCQPFKRKVNEQPKVIKTKSIEITDHGDEIAFPYIEINSKGGDITLNIGSNSLTILRTQSESSLLIPKREKQYKKEIHHLHAAVG